MKEWWLNISGLERVYFVVACVATLIMVIQIILMLIGFAGDGDADMDMDSDGISLFTIKGLVAFFSIGGWTGLILFSTSLPHWVGLIISVLAGALALFLVAIALKSMMKLQSNGNFEIDNCLNKIATVYVTIPSNMAGRGKVVLVTQEKYTELDAMTKSDRPLKTDESVKIISILGDTLIVEAVQ